MLPIIEVPETIATEMEKYRDVFCRKEGFEHVSWYVTGITDGITNSATIKRHFEKNIDARICYVQREMQ